VISRAGSNGSVHSINSRDIDPDDNGCVIRYGIKGDTAAGRKIPARRKNIRMPGQQRATAAGIQILLVFIIPV